MFMVMISTKLGVGLPPVLKDGRFAKFNGHSDKRTGLGEIISHKNRQGSGRACSQFNEQTRHVVVNSRLFPFVSRSSLPK